MTSSFNTTEDSGVSHKRKKCCNFGANAKWSATNIAVLVVAFVLFWPIGLFILYWILKGRNVADLPPKISEKWNRFKGNSFSQGSTSDNRVFNDYQQTQYDRILEIKDEIKSRTKRFSDFRSDAKRRADEDEFRRFMDEGHTNS
ncbi:MAG: hypothetical protein ACI8P9_003897 [Parasphingorhabdus sp.]|jgi:hypothetical protein